MKLSGARWRWLWVGLLTLALVGACEQQVADEGSSEEEPPVLPAVLFTRADGSAIPLYVEVADTPELAQCGLMHRLAMPPDQAMLFIFQGDYLGTFWNRNTFIPLSLAWLSSDGVVLGFSEMANVRPEDNPQINSYYSAPAPSRYVIEANQGWFAGNRVQVGDRADVAAAVAAGSGGAVPICREKGL